MSQDQPAEHHRIAIIGTGFAGLGLAIQLKQRGIEDFVVLERASDLGGTWRDNHYPGCCCDIPSHVYSFSFELNSKWTRGFAPQAEILDYLRATAEKHGILPHIRFDAEVLGATWDEDAQRWDVETADGPLSAQLLVSGAGGLSDPATPDLPGMDTFEGTTFHSAQWDHEHDLDDERVAVIGTGASAIQFVPAIQPRVGKLHLFQRTPPWVMPRMDHEISKPEHWLLKWIPFAPRLVRTVLYWLLEIRVVGFRNPRIMKGARRIAAWHLRRQVPDRELRRRLTPDYTIGCKRILISDDYYPSLTRPNIDVVTSGVKEVRPRSIVDSDGVEREVDTIIFGTGFHIADPPIAERIHGRGGQSLAERWRAGMQGYLGSAIPGFPNFFMLVGPNTGLGHNSMVFMIESQIAYLLEALRAMDAHQAGTVEVREDVVRAYNEELQDAMEGTVWTAGHCKSWYLDDTGRNTTLWPGWSYKFRQRTARFDPGDYVLEAGAGTQPAGYAPAGISPA